MSIAENLPQLQRDIFTKISNNKTDELKVLLATNKVKVDFIDENGMSPLQHACYKGNKEIVQMLLDHGADTNECQHEHGYTALHFAALSGNTDLCHLLMSYGAKMGATNSVGRTAAQMAAFVGNHDCVATINYFIPKADIDYYIKPQGLQTEPVLHPHLTDSFHLFIMQVNTHPIRVVMNLQKYRGLMDNLPMIQKVLELMRHREMTKRSNEDLAFKYHYLSCIVAEVIKCQKRQGALKAENSDKVKGNEERKSDVIKAFAKKFLKCKSDGTLEYQELFLKETVRGFHYRDSIIFQKLVTAVNIYDPPDLITVISKALHREVREDSLQTCITCSEEGASKKCSKCKMVQYCDRECQRLHWFVHKKTCNRLSQSTTSNVKVANPKIEDMSNETASCFKNFVIN